MQQPILIRVPEMELIGKPADEAAFRIHRYTDRWVSFEYFLSTSTSEQGIINDVPAYTFVKGDGLYIHFA